MLKTIRAGSPSTSTAVESPPRLPPEGAPSGRRRRRWPRRTLVAIPIVLIVGGVSTLAWAATYDPLCHRPCGGVSGFTGRGVTDLGMFRSPEGDEFTALRVQFRPGGRFGLWFSLMLDGGPGVTVTHVGWPTDRFDQLPIIGVRRQRRDAGGTSSRSLVPLEPFSLRPGDEADILVTIGMRGCQPGPSSVEFGPIPVTYRFLGITQHTTVFLPESVEVVGQPGVASCPPFPAP